ncbi:MAG: YdcF family protein [Thiohalocapsa sp.]
MEAYSVVKQLLLPPGIILVMLAIGFFLVRGTLGRLVLFVAWSLLFMMSLPGLAVPFIGTLERYPALDPSRLSAVDAEAIVVLGATVYSAAPEYGGNTVDGNSLKRVRYAAWLHRYTGLPVYVTGGAGDKAPAPAMVRVLEDEYGVPVTGVEQDSRTTWENAMLTVPLLRADGVGRILLVTQAWHMPRAVAAFERTGIDVVPAPTDFVLRESGGADDTWRDRYRDWLPQAAAFQLSYYALHEKIGQVYYDLRAKVASGTLSSPSESADVGR